ncbi:MULTISPECIES: virion core protein, T7 gp14 family [Pseudomonas]|uniref:Phage protein n=1 Tax=Pseudomonas lutea TaxID=243924 RepID=A0A9X8MHN8_9PSED|nr:MULTISPECIES: hypothetical protein [Pseudomonas]SER46301.1 hypothetical protein SAMN05216409_12415 [Pseudomonas lutea]
MCGPAAILPALAVGSGVLGAVNSIGQANAAAATAKRQAGYLNTQAAQTIEQGGYQSDQALTQGQHVIGAQRAAYGGGNIDVNSGSALRVQESAQTLSEEDAQNIRLNAARQAWGYQTQAKEVVNQAKQQKKSAAMSAVGSLLTAGAGAYSLYGSLGSAGSGLSLQGQKTALTKNAAFVRNM